MRVGDRLVVALGLVAAATACSGGYPLPPTRCDRWCDATKGGICPDYYNPAGCVASCESSHLTDVAACDPELEEVIACFHQTPGAAEDQCEYHPDRPALCYAERQSLGDCVAYSHLISGPPK